MLEIGSGLMVLRFCLTLSGDKISSASIFIHQPQRSITRHAAQFGTLIIENRRIACLICRPGKTHQARGVGDSLKLTTAIARFAGSIVIGALILGLTPQALCWRPLSRTDFLLGDSHPDLTVGAIA